jgi:hypothetical protein
MSSVNNFTKVANTVVSAPTIISAMSNANCRDLLFNSSNAPTTTLTVAANVTLAKNFIQQALVSSQPVNSAAATSVLLGPDAASQAQAYIDLFNIRSTNEVRVLRFHAVGVGAASTLANNDGTTNRVVVALSGTPGASASLFNPANAVGAVSAGKVGSERIVLVSASNLNSGSQTVTFNVLGISS